MTLPLPLPDLPPDTLLRSGTAARLAGLPATTLRVWERRYAVVAAPKTPTGQRLYAVDDVRRLALLRQLTAQGHAIGTIAGLSLDALQGLAASMSDAARTRAAAADGSALVVVAVGPSIATRMSGSPWAAALQVHADLGTANASFGTPVAAPRHLLVEAPALSPALADEIGVLARHADAGATVVYRFGPAPVLKALAAAGILSLREPVSAQALARRLDAAARAMAPMPAAPRRFSDAELAHLAALPSLVLCECPRHLAEIVAQLAGFERYSAACGHANPGDAALHRRLLSLAADARARFEQALAEVAAAEGLSVGGP